MSVSTGIPAQLPATTIADGVPRPPVPTCVTWVAVLIVVMVGKVSDWVPGMASIPLAKIAFLIAAISAFRSQTTLEPVRVRSLLIARPALAFMVLAILSVSFSIYKSETVNMSLVILILLLSMTLLLKVAQNHRDIERLLWGFAAAGASLSLGLLLNFHGGRGDINGNFDPNDIAYALDTLLPIVLALRVRRSRAGSIAMTALTLISVLSVLLTGSRGGAIGLAVVAVAILAFPLSRTTGGVLRKFSFSKTLGRVVILLAVGAVSWNYLPQQTRERTATLLDLGNDYNADPTLKGGRTVIWKRDVSLALQRPIGYGLGSAEIVDGLNGGQYRTAHNSLVEAFVELGALGLVLFCYCYISSWNYLGRVVAAATQVAAGEPEQKSALYARALRIALAGNLTAGFFLSNAYSPVLWMTVAISAALVRVSARHTDSLARGTQVAAEVPDDPVGDRH